MINSENHSSNNVYTQDVILDQNVKLDMDKILHRYKTRYGHTT